MIDIVGASQEGRHADDVAARSRRATVCAVRALLHGRFFPTRAICKSPLGSPTSRGLERDVLFDLTGPRTGTPDREARGRIRRSANRCSEYDLGSSSDDAAARATTFPCAHAWLERRHVDLRRPVYCGAGRGPRSQRSKRPINGGETEISPAERGLWLGDSTRWRGSIASISMPGSALRRPALGVTPLDRRSTTTRIIRVGGLRGSETQPRGRPRVAGRNKPGREREGMGWGDAPIGTYLRRTKPGGRARLGGVSAGDPSAVGWRSSSTPPQQGLPRRASRVPFTRHARLLRGASGHGVRQLHYYQVFAAGLRPSCCACASSGAIRAGDPGAGPRAELNNTARPHREAAAPRAGDTAGDFSRAGKRAQSFEQRAGKIMWASHPPSEHRV